MTLSQSEVPEAIRAMAAEYKRKHPTKPNEPAQMLAGELVFVRNHNGAGGYYCVIHGQPSSAYPDHWKVWPTSNIIEMAYDLTPVVPHSVTNIVDLVVWSELYVYVHRDQIAWHQANLGPEFAEALHGCLGIGDRDPDFGYPTGPPLMGPADARWKWQHSELAAVNSLNDPKFFEQLFGE